LWKAERPTTERCRRTVAVQEEDEEKLGGSISSLFGPSRYSLIRSI